MKQISFLPVEFFNHRISTFYHHLVPLDTIKMYTTQPCHIYFYVFSSCSSHNIFAPNVWYVFILMFFSLSLISRKPTLQHFVQPKTPGTLTKHLSCSSLYQSHRILYQYQEHFSDNTHSNTNQQLTNVSQMTFPMSCSTQYTGVTISH